MNIENQIKNKLEKQLLSIEELDTQFGLLEEAVKSTQSGNLRTEDVKYEWEDDTSKIYITVLVENVEREVDIDEGLQGFKTEVKDAIKQYNSDKRNLINLLESDEYNKWQRNYESDNIIEFEGIDEEVIVSEIDDSEYFDYGLTYSGADGSESTSSYASLTRIVDRLENKLSDKSPIESYVDRCVYDEVYDMVIDVDGVGETYAHELALSSINPSTYSVFEQPDGMGYTVYHDARRLVEEELDLSELRDSYRRQAAKIMMEEFDCHKVVAETI